jgi:hypothetical protein
MIKQVPIKNILLQGTIGGLIAGLAFALAQMLFSAITYGAVLGAYAAAIGPSRAFEDAPRQTPIRSE